VNGVDFAEIVRTVNEDVSGSSESIRKGLTSSDAHDLFSGTGRFVDDRTVGSSTATTRVRRCGPTPS